LAGATQVFREMLRDYPNSAEVHNNLGLVLLQSKDSGNAQVEFQEALRLKPDYADAHYNLALAFLQKHDLESGLRELERTVSLNPQHTDALYNLGVVLLDMGRAEEALTRLRPLRKSTRPDVAYNVVRAELTANHLEDARQAAAEAARSLGKDALWQASV